MLNSISFLDSAGLPILENGLHAYRKKSGEEHAFCKSFFGNLILVNDTRAC